MEKLCRIVYRFPVDDPYFFRSLHILFRVYADPGRNFPYFFRVGLLRQNLSAKKASHKSAIRHDGSRELHKIRMAEIDSCLALLHRQFRSPFIAFYAALTALFRASRIFHAKFRKIRAFRYRNTVRVRCKRRDACHIGKTILYFLQSFFINQICQLQFIIHVHRFILFSIGLCHFSRSAFGSYPAAGHD